MNCVKTNLKKKEKKVQAIRHLVVGGGGGGGELGGLYTHHCYILYCHIQSNTLNSNVMEIFFFFPDLSVI